MASSAIFQRWLGGSVQTILFGYIDLSGNHFIISSHVYFNWNELQSIGLFFILFVYFYSIVYSLNTLGICCVQRQVPHLNKCMKIGQHQLVKVKMKKLKVAAVKTQSQTAQTQQCRAKCKRERRFFLTTDPGLWPESLTDHEREVIVWKLATTSQIDLIIAMSKDSERNTFPEYLQFSKSANGREKQKRDWLTYSPSMDALYCVPCMLFSHDDLRKASTSALNTKEGYKTADLKWRRMYDKFPDHEASKAHKACYLK